LDLLEALAGSVIEDHHEEAEKLASAVEQLPLALQVAGHLLREEKHSLDVASLLRDLQVPGNLLGNQVPADVAMSGERTISRLFKKSTDVLPDDARKCFAYLAPYAPKPARFNSIALAAQWKTIPVDSGKMAMLLVGRGLLEPVGKICSCCTQLKAHASVILTDREPNHACVQIQCEALKCDQPLQSTGGSDDSRSRYETPDWLGPMIQSFQSCRAFSQAATAPGNWCSRQRVGKG
jgi:hypothetical protein